MPDVEERFQALVGGLDYPMYIVTVAADDRRAGCLVGFGTQSSIDPPRYWICISKQNHTYRVARRADALAVHVLDRGHRELARLFGEETGDEVDKFSRCDWHPGPDGVTPVLSDCPRWFLGRLVDRVDSGDHESFLLEPVASSSDQAHEAQLGFQSLKDLEPGHPA
ncbi:MAG: flavin reductase family protein [Actinomycetota bacterium]|nr:flavin reductase family protein [Actinomycetota bacterium]